MAEQSNGLPEACGTKRFLETGIFMRTGKRATHHGSELGSIQKPNTFAQTISTILNFPLAVTRRTIHLYQRFVSGPLDSCQIAEALTENESLP
jgi:hypothetical protein